MNQQVVIRNETDADVSAITKVTIAAFTTLEVSNKTEQYIIEALRAAKALTVSLVAEVDGRVVGHIAFSPVTISNGSPNWYGLGPVSVLPDYQRTGVGQALISEGLSRLKELKAVVSWGTPGITRGSGSRTCPVWFMMECRRRYSSLLLSRGTRLRALSHSMRVSRRMANRAAGGIDLSAVTPLNMRPAERFYREFTRP